MRRLKAWCLCLAVFLFCAGSFKESVAARELIVAVDHAPPYRIIENTPSGPVYSGIYIDVVRVATARAGLVLRFEVVPFKRALHLMETGAADLMLGPNRTDERQQFIYYFGAALPNEPKAVYVGAMDRNVRQVSDLAHKSVGVLRGANYGWQLEDATDIRMFEAADYGTLFRMLDLHRIDALIVPELLALEQIKQEGPYRIRKSDLVLHGQPSFIVVSRSSDFFTDRSFVKFEELLVEMRQDGTFDEIYSHYAQSGS